MKVRFPAMRGVIGKRQYYSTTMPLSEIPRFFKFNNWEQTQLDPTLRAQRVLNVARVPEITRYIVDNQDGYIFSSLTASYSCPITFTPIDSDGVIGYIEMDLEHMEFIINDGQHRAAAIAEALKERPELGREQISILLFESEGLGRLQQMFSDLNRFVQKTSKSLNILYDHRDTLSLLTMDVADQVAVFQDMVEKEKTAIPLRSPKLLTLSSLYDANVELLGSSVDKPETDDYQEKVQAAVEYWTEVATAIPDWQQVKNGEIEAPQLRQMKINTHAVILRALGAIGKVLGEQHPSDWRDQLALLRDIDWRKTVNGRVNPLWDNVCIVAGSVTSNRQARVATQAVLKHWLDLPLGKQESQMLADLRKMGWKGIAANSKRSETSAGRSS